MTPLPTLMVAPNGARRGKADHPELPVTIPEIVATAMACSQAGATGIHAHVRDAEGRHVLDVGLYQELMAELARAVPQMFVQVTSEAAGRYGPAEQRAVVEALAPPSVSVALREMIPEPSELPAARRFYQWAAEAGVTIHHIAYARDELERLLSLIGDGTIPGTAHQVMLVLGSYDGSRESHADDIPALIAPIAAAPPDWALDWMLCAFGPNETPCLARAIALGGKARVGFENSLWNADGGLARDNAERVAEIVAAAGL